MDKSNKPARASNSKKILIIGGGISGLAAYHQLIHYGFDVTILEARNRCGGRIWISNQLDRPIGLGASWIHGSKNNPITLLAHSTHSRMLPVDLNEVIIFGKNGPLIFYKDLQQFNEKFDRLLKRSQEIAHKAKHDFSLSEILRDLMKCEKFSAIELDLFKAKLLYFESYLGAGYQSLSAKHWLHGEAWPGQQCYLIDTYQAILENLKKNCSIELNTRVTAIKTRPSEVEISTESSVFQADAVLITVPLGVLKKNTLVFDPPLPKNKQIAIERLGMGLFNITALQYPACFWPKTTSRLEFTQFDSSSIAVFFTFYQNLAKPILIGVSGGERALQIENSSDEELIEKTTKNFKKVFQQEIPQPEAYLNTHWASDPLSYGSYSYFHIGSNPKDRETLSHSISNRLFFAGEATCSKYPATTHGAYLSGIREAEKIHKKYM